MVTPEQKKEILALFEKGVSSDEIAEAMNINPPVIWGIRAHWSRGKYTANEASSERIDSSQIISELANGKNPVTGESFPAGHVLQNPTVIRSLFHALKAMEDPQLQKEQILQSGEIKCDEALLERLFILRKKLADERDVPAFCIFGNRSLQMMAHDYPTTLEEFELIYGVGEKRKQDLGEIFISTISDYLKDNPKQHFDLEEKPKDENISKSEQRKIQNIEDKNPINFGLPWPKESEKDLVNSYLSGKSIEKLAEEFERTTSGVTFRLQELAGVKFDELDAMVHQEKMAKLQSVDIESIPKTKPTSPIIKDGERLCGSCGSVIPRERVTALPDVIYCVNCQSEEESNNPDAMRKKAEEGFGGSREDSKKNRRGYFGDRR